ncbi:MAG: N-acetylmuramoyl-L-alanine amidase [Ruminococcaceae bacterium]|nr:N-acetylmuramoyl-L-alanine amidase [Oscillospiraceae bacterium]
MKLEKYLGLLPFYLLTAIIVIGFAAAGSRAVTASVQNSPVRREHRIVIDAGHGGVDGGATSCTGVLESQINLEIALRLRDVMHLLGHDTVMIRTTDISVYTKGETIAAKKVSDLKERVRIVNETPGSILVSIHQNTFSDSRYGGAQVFYPTTEGSKQLADRMQSALVKSLNPGSRRTAKKGEGIYLLERISCPGVLVECGFLSNPEEEYLLRSKDYQIKLCAVIAASISEYINA